MEIHEINEGNNMRVFGDRAETNLGEGNLETQNEGLVICDNKKRTTSVVNE